jgi:hypothetical protein
LLVDLHADSSSRPRDQIDSPGLQTGPYVDPSQSFARRFEGKQRNRAEARQDARC